MRLGLPLIAFVIGPMISKAQIQIQGHRGCRGYLPENTIPGFIQALEMGVDVLELDVVITGDDHVLVSHEPWMNPDICLGPQGQSLRGKQKVNIFQLTLAEVQAFDCGALGNQKFPFQQPQFVHKPTLEAVFLAVKQWLDKHPDRTCQFNIEIKRKPKYDGTFGPSVSEYCDRVLKVIEQNKMESLCYLQSFDVETLEHLHQIRPQLPIAYLAERSTFSRNIRKLSFQPQIYSPKFSLLNQTEVKQIHQSGMRVIPWTVNEKEDIQHMIELGVDGIISDYPDRVVQFRD